MSYAPPVSEISQTNTALQNRCKLPPLFASILTVAVWVWGLAVFQPTMAAGQGILLNGGNNAGTIAAAFEEDLWTFEATSGDTISLSMSVATNSQSIRPWIRLRGPDGVELANVYGSDLVSLVNLVASQTGTYTVVAASNDGSGHATGTGDYVLRLARTPASFVVPEGDEGGPMVNGANHTGTIHLGGMDLWTFEADQGNSILLTMQRLTGSDFSPSLRIYGPTGQLITSGVNASLAQVSFIAPDSGIFVLVASSGTLGGTGTYQLTNAGLPEQGKQLRVALLEPGSLTVNWPSALTGYVVLQQNDTLDPNG